MERGGRERLGRGGDKLSHFGIYLFEREERAGRIEVDFGKEKFSNGTKNRNSMRSPPVHISSAYPGCWLGRKQWLPNDGENAQRNEAQVSLQPLFKSTVKFLPTASSNEL